MKAKAALRAPSVCRSVCEGSCSPKIESSQFFFIPVRLSFSVRFRKPSESKAARPAFAAFVPRRSDIRTEDRGKKRAH